MDFPANLTPFSQSVLHPAIENALGRLTRELNFSSPPDSSNPIHEQGPRPFLAELTWVTWGGSAPEIGRLLGVDPPVSSRKGKPGQGMKQTQVALLDFANAYVRLRRWAEWVFASEWSQAQLLQVMEEVEPRVAEALYWVYALAVAAAGSYHHLGFLLSKKEKTPARAEAMRLGIVSGLETPDSRFLHCLALGKPVEELREAFGHLPLAPEGEIALPRVMDAPDNLLETPPVEVWNWDQGRAQKRRAEEEKRAIAQAGMLGRSGMKKAIDLTQRTLTAHAQAREGLAYVLAAARHWALAAAEEGASDGRIHHPDEIFMLEIEEIKQMMTGEWHSRAHVDSLIEARRTAHEATSATDAAHGNPLGVAGYDTEGVLVQFQSPAELSRGIPPGFMALAGNWHPGWWQVALKAEGLIDRGGHVLNWLASIARSGNLPALIGGAAYAEWGSGVRIRLDPARNRAETVD